jgi:hypothetical protein
MAVIILQYQVVVASPAVNVPINPVVINKWTGSWSTGANPVATEKMNLLLIIML